MAFCRSTKLLRQERVTGDSFTGHNRHSLLICPTSMSAIQFCSMYVLESRAVLADATRTVSHSASTLIREQVHCQIFVMLMQCHSGNRSSYKRYHESLHVRVPLLILTSWHLILRNGGVKMHWRDCRSGASLRERLDFQRHSQISSGISSALHSSLKLLICSLVPQQQCHRDSAASSGYIERRRATHSREHLRKHPQWLQATMPSLCKRLPNMRQR